MNADVARLLEDLRLLGPSGLERAVEAWRRAGAAEDAVRTTAEKRAEDDPEWREAESEVFRIAQGEAWLAVDQTDRDSAVDAALDALLAVLEREKLDTGEYRRLAAPMAAVLPWLLSGEAEDLYR
ncbi:MAG: hypothetical protein E6J29_12580 [Chloroflexi bacterium]|nr:MAG: hypothetical protein E6J29_12580 [Chloroflexota bacterium]TMD52290.1 MAG: hypothetical protein E6I85_10980 [Chloroflexota bacterium]